MEREQTDVIMEKKKRKRERILIAATLVLVLILTVIEANMASSITEIPLMGNVIVFIVINVNVLLILFLLFLVSRNFFKLFLERKRNVLGSKIRYRLVVTLLVFSLVPMVLFFFLSYKLTSSSINRWIGKQVGDGLRGSLSIGREYVTQQEALLKDFLLSAKDRVEEGKQIAPRESPWVPELVVKVGEGGNTYLRGAAEEGGEEVNKYLTGDMPGPLEIRTLEQYIYGAVILSGGGRLAARKEIPPSVYENMKRLTSAYSSYSQVRLLNDPIKATSLGILILISLLIIFTNTWIGFYLARDFSIPLKKLAEGTEMLSEGKEPVEIEYKSDDEFGMLVDSFNRMGKEIIQSRRELERLNRQLESSYYDLSNKAELIEAIISGISTGVITIDKAGKISMMNDVARAILEIEEDATGTSYRELFSQAVYEDLRREVGTLRPGEKETTEKNIRVEFGGTEKYLVVRATILNTESGQYQGTVVTIEDITKIRRIQEITAWREMARKVAHEIKNPLTPIKLSAQRLKKRFGGKVEEEGELFHDCVDTIIDEVDTIGRLVDDFYRFERMPEMKKEVGDMGKLARQVSGNYRELYPHIDFEVIEKESCAPFHFDLAKMKMAFVNLLENSLWAVRQKGGKGKISIILGTQSKGEVASVSVEDNGIGIPQKEKERVFDLYYSGRDGGKGVGLSIVRSIMGEHDGKVYAAHGSSGGARIVMELPARREGQ